MTPELLQGLVIGPPSNPTVMRLTEFKGRRLLDIRRHFVDKKTGELLPTKKGISMNASVTKAVVNAFESNGKEICDYLEGGKNEALLSAGKAMTMRSAAANEEGHKPVPFRDDQEKWKGAEFFKCRGEGGIDSVTLNVGHPFFALVEKTGQPATRGLLALVLESYFRAKIRFAGEIEANAENFFALLEHEWGLMLNNYCDLPGSGG